MTISNKNFFFQKKVLLRLQVTKLEELDCKSLSSDILLTSTNLWGDCEMLGLLREQ